jgi:hypothetical protein
MLQRFKCLLNRHDWQPGTDETQTEPFWRCSGCAHRRDTDPHGGDAWRAHSGGSTTLSGGGFGI